MSSRGARARLVLTGTVGALVLVLALAAVNSLQARNQLIVAPARATPRLKTAINAGKPYTSVMGLGDSVTTGAGCSCASFVAQLGARLTPRMGTSIAVRNAGVDGLTSHDLLQQVTRNNTRALAHTVTAIAIGANDFDPAVLLQSQCGAPALSCYQLSLASLRANVDGVLSALRSGVPGSGPVLILGYWNVFLDGAVGARRGVAYETQSDALTRAVNSVLAREAETHSAAYINLYTAFKKRKDDTPLLAADGDHPSAAGHTLIAVLLSQALGLQAGAVGRPSP